MDQRPQLLDVVDQQGDALAGVAPLGVDQPPDSFLVGQRRDAVDRVRGDAHQVAL